MSEMQELREKFRAEMQELREKFKAEMQELRRETREDIKEQRAMSDRCFEALMGEIKFLQKQIWFLYAVVAVGFFAGGDPENPILKGLFGLFGIR